jgi:WD40 repeat protein
MRTRRLAAWGVAAVFTLAGVAAHAQVPKGSSKVQRIDFYGNALPPGAVAQLGRPRGAAGGWVNTAAFAPAGKVAASGSGDGLVRLWNVATGAELRRFGGPFTVVSQVVFAPDGKSLAASGAAAGPTVCVWDAATGQDRWRQLDLGRAIAFSPDGKLLAAGCPSGAISLRDATTGKEQCRLEGHQKAPSHLAFLEEGRTLASVSDDGTIRLWDVAAGKERRREASPDATSGVLGFSPDGRTLIAQPSGTSVLLWDVADGKERRRLRSTATASGMILGCSGALSADGKWLAVGDLFSVLHLWEVATGKEVQRCEAHDDRITALAFAPDGRSLVSGGWDASVRLWNVPAKEQRPTTTLVVPEHQAGGPPDVVFLPDGKRVATSTDRSIYLWEVAGGRGLAALPPGVISPDGRLVARQGPDHTIQVSELTRGKILRQLRGHKGEAMLAFSADGKLLASSSNEEGATRIWDTITGKERRLVAQNLGVPPLAFAADGKRLLAGSKVWDVATGKELCRCDDVLNAPRLSPDGKTVAQLESAALGKDEEGRLILRDVASGAVRHLLSDLIFSLTFSPDGRTLAIVQGAGMEHILLVRTDGRLGPRMESPGEVRAVTFAPDGRMLATAGHAETVRLWETASGHERHHFTGHKSPIRRLVFSSDGRWLASASEDTTVIIWDMLAARPPAAGAPSPADLKALWYDLAGGDARRAYQAVLALAGAPKQAVPFLQGQLRPPSQAVSAARLAELLRDLDHKQFAIRTRATAQLQQLGAAIEPALEKALEQPRSEEMRRRVQKLLDRLHELHKEGPPPEELRRLRAVEALERAGGAEARQLLETLAGDAYETSVARSARAALARLSRRPAHEP